MATYYITGTGNSLLEAYSNGGSHPAPLAGNLLYVSKTEFGIRNADGSFTYVTGKGFSFDQATGEFTGGTITAIRHFDAHGVYIDDVKDLASPLSVKSFQTALEDGGDALAKLLFSGDDHLNAFYFKGTDGGVTLNGYAGNDTIYGSSRGDTLFGGEGHDKIIAGAGDDLAYGGNGNDKINGGAGDDRLYGDTSFLSPDTGKDTLSGGGGNDWLDGGKGNDRLSGGNGKDTLNGGVNGDDTLTGGKGADVFVFSFSGDGIKPVGGEWGNDVITDFEVGVDKLILSDMLNRDITLCHDADGNAVIRIDADNTVTLMGVSCKCLTLDDLVM
jgi:Ca2+-binding RTX toxin-like protein